MKAMPAMPTKAEPLNLKKLTLDAVWDGIVIGGLVVMVPMAFMSLLQLIFPPTF